MRCCGALCAKMEVEGELLIARNLRNFARVDFATLFAATGVSHACRLAFAVLNAAGAEETFESEQLYRREV